MTEPVSPNTQAILLLTAPLLLRSGPVSKDLLRPAEYRRLALGLREKKRQPADLLESRPAAVLNGFAGSVDVERIERLLARGFLLSQALERWQARAIWVLSRADEAYPRRLKVRMRETAPALLYGCGNRDILNTGGLAVVGPRDADELLIRYSADVGRLGALAGQTVISGGARGVDLAAMQAAAEARGRVVGVLAEDLERAAMDRDNRDCLMGGRLVLVSEYDPNSKFTIGHAMERNKLIYAFADVALVVNAEVEKGGTWAGAVEQIGRLRYAPVFVRSTGAASPALEALKARGARYWPNPADTEGLRLVLESVHVPDPEPAHPILSPLVLFPRESALAEKPRPTPDTAAPLSAPDTAATLPAPCPEVPLPALCTEASLPAPYAEAPLDAPRTAAPLPPATSEQATPAEQLFLKVRELVMTVLTNPRTEAEVAQSLGVGVGQAKEWLRRLASDGLLDRRGRPTRYGLRPDSAGLFRIDVLPPKVVRKRPRKASSPRSI